jgi:hypothetical protein
MHPEADQACPLEGRLPVGYQRHLVKEIPRGMVELQHVSIRVLHSGLRSLN